MRTAIAALALLLLAACAAEQPSTPADGEVADAVASAPPIPPPPTPDTPPLPPTPEYRDGQRVYAMSEVAKHDGEGSCWTVIRGEVYGLTEWIARHPGGADNILRLCGIDGTEAFEGKHSGKDGPEETLEGYRIGILA